MVPAAFREVRASRLVSAVQRQHRNLLPLAALQILRDSAPSKLCDLRTGLLRKPLERLALMLFEVNHSPYLPHGANCAQLELFVKRASEY
jgi:hypothetical protein